MSCLIHQRRYAVLFIKSIFLLSISIIVFSCNQSMPVASESEQATQINQSELHAFDGLAKPLAADRPVRVMTRNVYIGADVDAVLSAENPEEIPVLAAQAFQQLLATNFPERAVSLVREIALTKPDLVGLQEVSLIRLQSPGDAIIGGETPAEKVFMNYLDILMQVMEAFDLNYKMAAQVQNADIELPMLTGTDPMTFDDIRVTDFDVILVKESIDVSDVTAKNYKHNLVIPDLDVEILRGYTAVNAKVAKRSYRFVNTHLEAFAEPIRMAQAQELLASLQGEKLPVIMVGDFNSPAPEGAVYTYIRSNDFTDIWPENMLNDNPEGFTYGHDADLRNEDADFYERIDHIYVRYEDSRLPLWVHAIVVGDESFNRTASGLWPSDHGGVAARLRIPSPANVPALSRGWKQLDR